MSGQKRRQAIIEAAIRLFSERGFRGVTTREIAAEVGVTEPVLYHHFPSKQDLYSAIIERKIEHGKDLFQKFEKVCNDPLPIEQFFMDLGLLIVEWHSSDPSFLRLMMFATLEDHELSHLFHNQMANKFNQTLVGAIERHLKGADCHEYNAEVASYTFCSMIAHHCLERLIFKYQFVNISDEEAVRSMVNIFLHGLIQRTK